MVSSRNANHRYYGSSADIFIYITVMVYGLWNDSAAFRKQVVVEISHR